MDDGDCALRHVESADSPTVTKGDAPPVRPWLSNAEKMRIVLYATSAIQV